MDSTITLLLELLPLAAIAGAGLYFKGYLPEKGKNLATKEDIAVLTRLVEATKLDYSRQFEAFRSSLQHQWGAHTDYARDRKEALFQYFEACTLLLADKFSVNLGDLPSDQGEALYKYQESVGQLFTRIYLDYLKLSLFFPAESGFMVEAEMLTKFSFEARREFNRHFGKAKIALVAETSAQVEGDRAAFRAAVAKSNEATKAYSEALQPIIQRMNQHFQAYVAALNTFLRESGSRPAPEPDLQS